MSEDDNDTITPSDALQATIAEDWEERYKRPRGILTDTDRQFLWGVKEYPHQTTEANRRQDIRQRVENGILDLGYLDKIDPGDRGRIIGDLREDTGVGEFHSAVATLIEFLYLGLGGDSNAVDTIEDMVQSGVLHGAETGGKEFLRSEEVGDVTVTIEIERVPDADELYRKYKESDADSLSSTEIGILVRAGKLTPEDLEDLDWTSPKEGEGLGIPDNSPKNGLESQDQDE